MMMNDPNNKEESRNRRMLIKAYRHLVEEHQNNPRRIFIEELIAELRDDMYMKEVRREIDELVRSGCSDNTVFDKVGKYLSEWTFLPDKDEKFEIDKISSSITASQRNRISVIKELISSLEKQVGKTISIEDLVTAAKEKAISRIEVEEIVEKLIRAGDLFELKRGFISRI